MPSLVASIPSVMDIKVGREGVFDLTRINWRRPRISLDAWRLPGQ